MDVERLAAEVLETHQGLVRLCRGAASDAYLEAVRKKQIAIDRMYRRPRSALAGSSAETRSWEQVALSNPAQYPLALDDWLSAHLGELTPPEWKGRPAFTYALHQLLMQNLTGRPSGQGFRELHDCAQRHLCPSRLRLSEVERQQVQQEADRLEALIRQQRWNALSIP